MDIQQFVSNNGSGILGLIGTIISTAVTAATQQNINNANIQNAQDINNAMIHQANQAANAANMRARENYWDLQSPASMVGQYETAGLSPGLMYSMGYGSGSGVNVAPMAQTPQLATPNLKNIYNGIGDDVMSMLKGMSEIDVNEEEVKLKQKQAEKIMSDIEVNNTEIDRILKDIEEKNSNINLNNIRTMNEAIKGEILQVQKEVELATKKDKIKIVTESLRKLEKENDKLGKEIELAKIDIQYAGKLKEAQLKNLAASTTLLWQQECESYCRSWLAVADIQMRGSEIHLNSEQIKNLQKDREKADALMNQINAQIELWNKQGEKIELEKVTEVIGWIEQLENILNKKVDRMAKGVKIAKDIIPYVN